MKSINIYLASLAISCLALSCAKTGVENVAPIDNEEETPVAVEFMTNLNVNAVASTKAGIDNWAKQKLYIYSFPTNSIPAADSDSILIKNAVAEAPDVTAAESKDIQPINVYKDSQAKTFYYYPADKTTFDFYAYYVDNAYVGTAPAPTITAGTNVSLPIVLDGTQDIMLATTDKEADVAGKGVAPSSAYSAYSARKDVKPNLVFNHQLSRFVFRIIAGNAEGKFVRIDSVTLTSNSKADLLIVNKAGASGISNADSLIAFTLQPVADGTAINEFKPTLKTSPFTFENTDKIGESIMVIPNTEHKLRIKMQQLDSTDLSKTLGDPFYYDYDLKPSMVLPAMTGTTFLAGYQYYVNVVVYGREKVLVNVTLTPWGEGGAITIDNDTEWGDEPKYGIKTDKGVYLYFYGEIAVDTVVKVWDKDTNTMIPATAGDYTFSQAQGDITGVTLTTTEGVTKVSAVITNTP